MANISKHNDLFDVTNGLVTTSIFDKCRHHWSVDDYRTAMSTLSNAKLNFIFFILDRRCIVSPAFMSLSPRASKLYVGCVNSAWFDENYGKKRDIAKHNDGDLAPRARTRPFEMPYNLCKLFNVGDDRQIKKAFEELKAFGFIEQIGVSRRRYPNVYKHSDAFLSLTWHDCESIKSTLSATKKRVKNKHSCHIASVEYSLHCHIASVEQYCPTSVVWSKMPYYGSIRGSEQHLAIY